MIHETKLMQRHNRYTAAYVFGVHRRILHRVDFFDWTIRAPTITAAATEKAQKEPFLTSFTDLRKVYHQGTWQF